MVSVKPIVPTSASLEPERPRPPAGEMVDFWWIVAAGLLLFGLNVDFQLRGDASMYADYVLQGKFNELTLHIGYYGVGYALHHTLGALFRWPIEQTLTWLNVGAGALALGFMYRLARRFLGTRAYALLCTLVLAVSGRVLANATSSEIYMLQTCVVTASFLLFVDGRIVAAGLLGGAALLVSPLSAFAYLFYPVYDYQRAGKVRWAVWLRLAGAALVVYLPYFVVFWRELFWGHRGLLNINGGVPFLPLEMAKNVPLFLFKHYTFLLLLLLPALAAIPRERRFLWLTLAVVLPHLYIASKLVSEDNVFLLNTDFFVATWLVMGWRELARWRWGRVVAPALLAAHVAVFLVDRQLFGFQSHAGYADEMRQIAGKYVLGRDATIVSDWDTEMVLTFYGRPAIVSTIEHDPLYQHMYDINLVAAMDPRKLDAPQVYLLESWDPGPLTTLLRSDAQIEALRRTHTVLSKAAKLGLECTFLERTADYPIYRCVHHDKLRAL